MEIILIILISLSMGSFANNVISAFIKVKVPDIFHSECFCGEKILQSRELFPIASYVFQKGKCNYCNEKIPNRYILTELIILTVGMLCYAKYGLTIISIYNFLIIYTLILIAIIDYYKFIIPNILLIPLIAILLIKYILMEDLQFIDVIISFVLLIVLLIINNYYEKFKSKQAIGYGDIKLIALLTIIFTFPLSIIGLWIASLIAIPGFYLLKINSTRFKINNKVPFGFFLSICYIVLVYVGDKVEIFYFHFIGLLQ